MPDPSLRSLIEQALGSAGNFADSLPGLGSPTAEDRRKGDEWLSQQLATPESRAAYGEAMLPKNPLEAFGSMTGGPALGGMTSGTGLGDFRLKEYETTDVSKIPFFGGLIGGMVQDPSQALDVGLLGAAGAKSLAPRVGPLARQAAEALGPLATARQPAEASVEFATGGLSNLINKAAGLKPDPRTAADVEAQATRNIRDVFDKMPGAEPWPLTHPDVKQPVPENVEFPTRGGPSRQELNMPAQTRPSGAPAEPGRSQRPELRDQFGSAEDVFDLPDDTTPRRPIPLGPFDPKELPPRPPTPRDTSGLQATNDVGNRTMAPLESTRVLDDEAGWLDQVVGESRANLPDRPQATGRLPQDQLQNQVPPEFQQRRAELGNAAIDSPLLGEQVELSGDDLDRWLQASRVQRATAPQPPSRTHQIELAKQRLGQDEYERGVQYLPPNEHVPLTSADEPVGPVRSSAEPIPPRPPTRPPDAWHAPDLADDVEFNAPGRVPPPVTELVGDRQAIGVRTRPGGKKGGQAPATGLEKELFDQRVSNTAENMLGNPANEGLWDTAHTHRLESRAYRETDEIARDGTKITHPPLWKEIENNPNYGVKPGDRRRGPIFSSRPPDMRVKGWQYTPEGREFLMKEAMVRLTGTWQGRPRPQDVTKFINEGRSAEAHTQGLLRDPDIKSLQYRKGKQVADDAADVDPSHPVWNDETAYDWNGNQFEQADIADLTETPIRQINQGDPYSQKARQRTLDASSRDAQQEGGNALVFDSDEAQREFFDTVDRLKDDSALLDSVRKGETKLGDRETELLKLRVQSAKDWIDDQRASNFTVRESNTGLHDTGRHDLRSRDALPEGMNRIITDAEGNTIIDPRPGGTRERTNPSRHLDTPENRDRRYKELLDFGQTPEVSPAQAREWQKQDIWDGTGRDTTPMRPRQPQPGPAFIESEDELARMDEALNTYDYRSREGQGLGDIDPALRPEQRGSPNPRPAPVYTRTAEGKLVRREGEIPRENVDRPGRHEAGRMVDQEFDPSTWDSADLDNALQAAVRKNPGIRAKLKPWQQRRLEALEEKATGGRTTDEGRSVRLYNEDMRARRDTNIKKATERAGMSVKGEALDRGKVALRRERIQAKGWLEQQAEAIRQQRAGRTTGKFDKEPTVEVVPELADNLEKVEATLKKSYVPHWVLEMRRDALREVEKAKAQRPGDGRRLVTR